jgi:tRNA/rRNA methyltransferase/tRNA (cytidine32/uridine32-2'-O)-methyltransferase
MTLDNEILTRVRIVLVETSHPGNIGGVARAMKTMGLTQLRLVAPKKFPHAEASARAAGATDLLATAEVFEQLADAVADCALVLATSARERTIAWPMYDPREAAARAVAQAADAPVALVFGPERVGLSNRQLDLCHALVQIPSNPDYSSLNLSAAAQVLCYELRVAALQRDQQPKDSRGEHIPADAGEVERFYGHLLETLTRIGFLDPENPRQLERRLRRMFNRMQPDTMEVNILRGILTAIQQHPAAKSGTPPRK